MQEGEQTIGPVASPDYPAAHSMDSCWFAVDELGEIAVFETHAEGVMPLEPRFPASEPDRAPSLRPSGPALEYHVEDLVLDVLRARAPENAEWAKLLEADGARDVMREWGWFLGDHPVTERLLSTLGVHCYQPVNAYGPQPYVRASSVQAAAKLEELPSDAQVKLSPARLPLRFHNAEALSPGEHIPVGTYRGANWWDTGGEGHPEGVVAQPTSRKNWATPKSPSPLSWDEVAQLVELILGRGTITPSGEEYDRELFDEIVALIDRLAPCAHGGVGTS